MLNTIIGSMSVGLNDWETCSLLESNLRTVTKLKQLNQLKGTVTVFQLVHHCLMYVRVFDQMFPSSWLM